MIQLTSHMRILVATAPVDMRKQIDGLASYCRAALGEEPMSGAVFVFTGRNRQMVRLLAYDNQGFWLLTKRLSQGKFSRISGCHIKRTALPSRGRCRAHGERPA